MPERSGEAFAARRATLFGLLTCRTSHAAEVYGYDLILVRPGPCTSCSRGNAPGLKRPWRGSFARARHRALGFLGCGRFLGAHLHMA